MKGTSGTNSKVLRSAPLTESVLPAASMRIGWLAGPCRSGTRSGSVLLGGAQVDIAGQRIVEQRGGHRDLAVDRARPGTVRRRTGPGCRRVPMWFWSRNSVGGSCDRDVVDVGVAGARLQHRGQGRVPAALGAALEREADLRLELELPALAELEAVLSSGATLPCGSRAASRSRTAGSQLVGLRVKLGLSIRIEIERTSSGMPLRIVGIGSEIAVSWAVAGSRLSAVRTTIVPRSNGPATAGVTIAEAQRRAFVRAGEVGLAGGVVGGRAGAGGGVDVADPEAAGQLGLACSSSPVLLAAAARAASEQVAVPASLATRPGGGFTVIEEKSLGAVFPAQVDDEGPVDARRAERSSPPSKSGVFGSWSSLSRRVAAVRPRVIRVVVDRRHRRPGFGRRPGRHHRGGRVGSPQVAGGVWNGARAPPKKVSLKSSNGQLRVFVEDRRHAPGLGVERDLAGQLDDDARDLRPPRRSRPAS